MLDVVDLRLNTCSFLLFNIVDNYVVNETSFKSLTSPYGIFIIGRDAPSEWIQSHARMPGLEFIV